MPRKRSFDIANHHPSDPYFASLQRRFTHHGEAAPPVAIDRSNTGLYSRTLFAKRRSISSRCPNMPGIEVSTAMITPFPSFMSVVGNTDMSLGKNLREVEELSAPDALQSDTQILITDTYSQRDPPRPASHGLLHRGSITSMTTASTDSSPTTTHSTFDSPLITDNSPSSSPESASSAIPPVSPFKNMMLKSSHDHSHSHSYSQPDSVQQSSILHQVPRLQPIHPIQPSSLLDSQRNVKNLSLNVNTALPRPATSAGFESYPFSAPTSPLKTGRRKPANLTIRTPGFQQLSFARPSLDVPATPSSRPTLHHMSSSPALASLASPTKAPPSLFLNLPSQPISHSRPGSESSSSGSVGSGLPELREEDEHHPSKSQETQEKGYPNGPVCIYDAGVYLYAEPTAEEASNFDAVFNVAKEIKCPFDLEARRPKPDIPEPQTAISEISFKSAWEWPVANDVATPTTPKANSTSQKQPEYLHVPWDHNSEILEDLYCLCRLIDERIARGRKVLIHCQLGVSRSASLVIAYGLYKGYQPDFHSMYMAVKKRSEWVGPNMSLIYQLTDFRSKVEKGVYGDHCFKPSQSWWKIRSADSPAVETPLATAPMWNIPWSNADSSGAPKPPRPSTVTVEPALEKASVAEPTTRPNKVIPPVPLFSREERKTPPLETPMRLGQILGSIATPSPPVAVRAKTPESESEQKVLKRAASRPLPFRERFENASAELRPWRPHKSPRLPALVVESPQMDLAMQDVPETPSLFSPRAMEFTASPFGITGVGDLAVSRIKKKGPLLPPSPLPQRAPAENSLFGTRIDPRSPHQHGETVEILRHIDDFL